MRSPNLAVALGLLLATSQASAAQRAEPRDRNQSTNRDVDAFDDWTARGFENLDRNSDGAISSDEWRFDRPSFRRADHNDDGTLSRSEFLNQSTGIAESVVRFNELDVNRDRRISRDEWRGGRGQFNKLDDDKNGTLTRAEFGVSPGNRGNRRDAVDGQAYQSGRTRGMIDGRLAGREDRDRRQGWDLEGQRELEQADAGYQPSIGALADYQRGYRAGFTDAYREAYGPR